MKLIIAIGFIFGSLAVSNQAIAEEWQSSRSAAKRLLDHETDLAIQMRLVSPISKLKPLVSENYAASSNAQALSGLANRHDQLFEIYSANVFANADFDGDGYHHAVTVNFDADVSVDKAWAYAKLYLSREGGAWSQYYTTDLFELTGDTVDDAYEVETELLEGYRPGHYDVLIEIYSIDHAFMVASHVIDVFSSDKVLMLEDLNRDTDDFDHGFSIHAGDSGPLLAFIVLIRLLFGWSRFAHSARLAKPANNLG